MGMNLIGSLSGSPMNVNISWRSQLSGREHRVPGFTQHRHWVSRWRVCGAVSAGRYLAQLSSCAPATPRTWCDPQLPFDLNSEGWRGEGGGRRRPRSWAISAFLPALSCGPVEAQCPPSEGWGRPVRPQLSEAELILRLGGSDNAPWLHLPFFSSGSCFLYFIPHVGHSDLFQMWIWALTALLESLIALHCLEQRAPRSQPCPQAGDRRPLTPPLTAPHRALPTS